MFKDNHLQVNTAELASDKALIPIVTLSYVHFVNTHPMGVNGDNFEFTSNLVTSGERPGVRCSQVNISIYGEKVKTCGYGL